MTAISSCCFSQPRKSCPTTTAGSGTVERVVRVVRAKGVDGSTRSRRGRVSYGCCPRNLMAIRRGSQRRLGRPSAVIAGATVTDSTVSVISRRHAADRLAGSGSLSMSSGPMTSLSPRSPSRARAVCVSPRALVSFSKVSWLAGRPNNPRSPSWRIASSRSALARSIASSASPICRLRDARPCASVVAKNARTASSTIASTRSALTAARRWHRFALVSPQR